MDKYEVIGLLGEGSFGRVYKAKRISEGIFVALKIISKRGRSTKELKGLRRECEIQRYLHHPNIIQMLDSFETDNEIVVITEFAHRELNYILGKEGYLSEERVQKIAWDLVSALYYLHSHRVLHRDLKPQNILIDANNVAKLCDFGFARNMSTGTHVLTSIKGTPLYMAPELIEEQPYDHNADLWSLGCIIYELLVGAPPFCTSSILHLIRLIKHEQIQWPTFLSANCISFLKGLLQKNPGKRMSWPEILNHEFVKAHILIAENTPSMPLTRPMSAHTLQVKKKQRNQHIHQKLQRNNHLHLANSDEMREIEKRPEEREKLQDEKGSKEKVVELTKQSQSTAVVDKLAKLSIEHVSPELPKAEPLDFVEDTQPIESEEWVVFLQKTMEEIMIGDITCMQTANSANVLVTPLRNPRASPKVIRYVANAFSLPFVVPGVDADVKAQVLDACLIVKLVPNLLYAARLLMRVKNAQISQETDASVEIKEKLIAELSDEELQCLEHVFLLVCHLIYMDERFIGQFCDAIVILKTFAILKGWLQLFRRRLRIATDLLAILTQVMLKSADNFDIVAKILEAKDSDDLDLVAMLRSQHALMRERICCFLLQVAKVSPKSMEAYWTPGVQETLEALIYDSAETVRNAAEMIVDALKSYEFYITKSEEAATR